MKRREIEEIPEGNVEGYLLSRATVGLKRPTHYFVLAHPMEHKVTRYYLPTFLSKIVNEYLGEYVQISKINKRITITPGGAEL